MAKETKTRVDYVEHDGRLYGCTSTFKTIGNHRYGKRYAYPALRWDDLTPEAQQHLLAQGIEVPDVKDGKPVLDKHGEPVLITVQAFPDAERGEASLDFGPRNRLAGKVGTMIAAAIVCPKADKMKAMIREKVGEMLNTGVEETVQEAIALNARLAKASHDQLVGLWTAIYRDKAEDDFDVEEAPSDDDD